jgi:putative acetyltransferase
MQQVTIQVDDPASSEARLLIAQLDEYLTILYPAESNYLLSIDDLKQPYVTFLTARLNGKVIGCGAFVNHQGEYAEIKRMFVMPEHRGHKIGLRILQELEKRAQYAGLALIKIETGILQTEALKLYERAGYHRCSPFGSYRGDDPLIVFMEKRLGENILSIRKCVLNDFPNIFKLLEQLWPTEHLDITLLEGVFRKSIASPTQNYLCACDGRCIVGFCSMSIRSSLWQAGNLAHIDELIVKEGYRGYGIGTRLLREAEAVAMRQNCKLIELDSGFHRENAHRFYQRNGYQNRGLVFSKQMVKGQ